MVDFCNSDNKFLASSAQNNFGVNMKKTLLLSFAILITFIISGFSSDEKNYQAKISDESQECVSCHSSVTPGIVGDWEKSLHSKITIDEALKKKILEKRISIDNKPSGISDNIVIGCYECHSLNAQNHKDNFEHFGYNINVIVSPNDCQTCHPVEVEQYSNSKKAFAHDILAKNPVYNLLSETLIGVSVFENNQIKKLKPTELTKGETCYACHGTQLTVNGIKNIETDLGEITVPNIENWPNQGVGRINPDGSYGACTACHPRHSFSIEVARKPHTCGQCHLEPDVPAYNVYLESKHGNIYESRKTEFNWTNVPWKSGTDFQSPTCASCHNSLLTDQEGKVISNRTHDFGSRLWHRIFGLVYSHPQPKSPKTFEIVNKDGFNLPTNLDASIQSEFLIDENEALKRKNEFSAVCKSCHSTSWSDKQLDKVVATSLEVDKMVKASTEILQNAWKQKLESNNNPFDESLESLWVRQWLIYANSVRYATAMMGPDYATFKNGWFEMTYNLEKMKDLVAMKRKLK